MSGAQEEMAAATATQTSPLDVSSAALGLQDRTQTALFEFRVFNITVAVLALCILVFTGLYCITVCFNRNRQWKRAHAYESAVTRGEPVDPVAVRAVKRSTSFINPFALFRRPEAERDKARIYYIYSNPLPVGLEEEEEEEREREKRLEERREQEERRLKEGEREPDKRLEETRKEKREQEKRREREQEKRREREQEKREQKMRQEEEEDRRRLCRAPCGLEVQAVLSQSLLIREYAQDPNSGVTLDPPMFYMQL
ncbi:unnamed protein product [Arctogadus glacialis]